MKNQHRYLYFLDSGWYPISYPITSLETVEQILETSDKYSGVYVEDTHMDRGYYFTKDNFFMWREKLARNIWRLNVH